MEKLLLVYRFIFHYTKLSYKSDKDFQIISKAIVNFRGYYE